LIKNWGGAVNVVRTFFIENKEEDLKYKELYNLFSSRVEYYI